MDAQERLSFEGWAKLPQFQRKVEQAKEIIREALAIAPAYVAVSWGKDSVIMLHLVQSIVPDIPAFFSAGFFMDTYDNFTETMELYCNRFPTNLIVDWQSREEALLPRNKPAPVKAAESLTYGLVFLGLRKEESKNRKRSLNQYGAIHQYKNGLYRACPLANWTTQDVWAYIVIHKLPYLQSYGRVSKFSVESRTTPHAVPGIAHTALAAKSREQLSILSEEFRQLMREFSC